MFRTQENLHEIDMYAITMNTVSIQLTLNIIIVLANNHVHTSTQSTFHW